MNDCVLTLGSVLEVTTIVPASDLDGTCWLLR